MDDGMERELAELFDASRVQSDRFQRVRMAARAAEVVDVRGRGGAGRAVAWLCAAAVCGVAVLLVAPADREVMQESEELDWVEYDNAVETYIDVAWNDGSLWADPLEGIADDLSEDALQEEYAALLDEMEI